MTMSTAGPELMLWKGRPGPLFLRAKHTNRARLGPWLWPHDHRQAIEEHLQLDCPSVPIGAALVISCDLNRTQGTLSLVGLPPNSHPKVPRMPLSQSARLARRDALVALSRSLPLLWTSLRDAERWVPDEALLLNMYGTMSKAPKVMNGDSLGLSLGLAFVSHTLSMSIPVNMLASATLDPYGRTGPVGDIAFKVRAALACAPGLTTHEHPLQLLIHQDNHDEAQAVIDELGAHAKVVKISSLSEAIERVWGKELGKQLFQCRTLPERQELVDAIFSLAIGDRAATQVWAPLIQTAEHPDLRIDLDEERKWRLDFAQAVARRHEARPATIRLPEEEWLQAMPHPWRLSTVAHLVQHTTHAESLEPQSMLDFAERHLVRGRDAFDAHLRLLGATGRLRAVTGEPEQALLDQLEAAHHWADRRAYHELSYPLSEIYRLVTALSDDEISTIKHPRDPGASTPGELRLAFLRDAEDLCQRAYILGAEHMSPYITVSRGNARLMSNRWPTDFTCEEAQNTLREILELQTIEDHLRWSAGRKLARYHRQQGHADALKEIEAIFDASEDPRRCSGYRRLIALDAALDTPTSNNPPGTALEAFYELCKSPTFRLIEAAPENSTAAYVRRFYPY